MLVSIPVENGFVGEGCAAVRAGKSCLASFGEFAKGQLAATAPIGLWNSGIHRVALHVIFCQLLSRVRLQMK